MRLLKCIICIAIVYWLSPLNTHSERDALDGVARAVIAAQTLAPEAGRIASAAGAHAGRPTGSAATAEPLPAHAPSHAPVQEYLAWGLDMVVALFTRLSPPETARPSTRPPEHSSPAPPDTGAHGWRAPLPPARPDSPAHGDGPAGRRGEAIPR